MRAFWIGHLGKYVPGKAMVVILRTGLVYSDRVNRTVAVTSVFIETLTMMAVGAFVAAASLMLTSENSTLMWLALGLMLMSGVPTWPPLFRRTRTLVAVTSSQSADRRGLARGRRATDGIRLDHHQPGVGDRWD